MKIKEKVIKITNIEYSKKDIQELEDFKKVMVNNLIEAKEKLKCNPKDFNALVDVSFYRLVNRRLDIQIKKLKNNPVEKVKSVYEKTINMGGIKK